MAPKFCTKNAQINKMLMKLTEGEKEGGRRDRNRGEEKDACVFGYKKLKGPLEIAKCCLSLSLRLKNECHVMIF